MENNKSKLIIGESKSKAINRFAFLFSCFGWLFLTFTGVLFFVLLFDSSLSSFPIEFWIDFIVLILGCFFCSCILRGLAEIVYAQQCYIATLKKENDIFEADESKVESSSVENKNQGGNSKIAIVIFFIVIIAIIVSILVFL